MKNILIAIIALIILAAKLGRSEEGMWIPLFLGELNEQEMKEMGMEITAEDIFSINSTSLKDAIVMFGRGCTGAVVSDQGLLLTNHHCGYGRIQAHSSLENDYLTNGFWAMDRSEELPNPGLTVTFLVRMEEVTGEVLDGVTKEMTEATRRSIIEKNTTRITDKAVDNNHYKAIVKPFFGGNRFFLFVNEVFEDVRLVGAPPSNIGKFGGDTDNWMWPRHTGDFSVFRIYASPDNLPASYSADNVPYIPKKHLTVSLNGYNEHDFTFVFGYPGSTESYIPSFSVELTTVTNPIRIKLRDLRLNIIEEAMNSDPEIRIQYSAKQASIANGWKKWIGENRGIMRLNAVERKRVEEKAFNNLAKGNVEYRQTYSNLLPEYEKVVEEAQPYLISSTYLFEAGFGIELLRYARSFSNLVTLCEDKSATDEMIQAQIASLTRSAEGHFKNYRPAVDQKIFVSLIRSYANNLPAGQRPEELDAMLAKHKGEPASFADYLYDKSIFSSGEKTISFLSKFKKNNYKKIVKDPAYVLAKSLTDFYYKTLQPSLDFFETKTDSLQRIYMQGLIEMQPERRFYPDANSTLRISYGRVMSYLPADAVYYHYFTTLEGIMEKEDPDIYDYVVEDRLKELHKNKEYGRYADKDGTLHTCFIATNHTSGGNSGSPVLNGKGELLGLNFDRCWEGTMSDIIYDPEKCRNITLDIRYCLFLIDTFAGAGHLVEEMTIIQ